MMKKILLLLSLMLVCIAILTIGALAADVSTGEEIKSITASAIAGDNIEITLKSDVEITEPIIIDKGITLTINFNGYTINYTGNKGSDSSKGAFVLKNKQSTLNLKGSNRLNSYKSYTHYDDTKKADMTGTGNLIIVIHGILNIENAYIISPSDAWAIFGKLDDNFSEITINNSVLRCPYGSTKSAITSEGSSNNGSKVKKRTIDINNSVVYGGFKGQNSFNYTLGTSFTNVKFYDFKIQNDCWYNAEISEIKEILMNSFENASPFTGCIFHTYEGEPSEINVVTATGKQNIKIIDCEFNGKITGSLNGDRGGSACVWVVTKLPTCQESGTAIKYTGGNISQSDVTVSANIHNFENGKIKYPKGYSYLGVLQTVCKLCGELGTKEGVSFAPIFKSKGYSISENGGSVSLGIKINQEMLDEFKASNPDINIEFGIIVGSGATEIEYKNGEISVTNGIFQPCKLIEADNFDVKISNIKDNQRDIKLLIESYVNDGENLEYIEEGLNLLSYNEIKGSLDKVLSAAKELLETKHKLYYNDDGSFRVLIIADAHMNSGADAKNVQEVKDRIKLLVDRENPNLVIFTGDNTINSSSEERLRSNIDILVSYIEENKIPWCHVYGNHDHEGALSHEKQQEIFESYEYCVSKTGPEISGTGNYVLGVYNKNETLGSVIYCLDSGSYDSVNGGYDYIKDDQIEWYKSTSMLLQEYNGGNLVKGIMAFHIPLIENNVAYENRGNTSIVYEATGDRNEGICASKTDTSLLETIFERGDVKAIVTGHDHVNDYMYNYYGVKLCSSPNVSDLTYYRENVQGGRVFDLRKDSLDNIPTYVSYIIERINPDSYGTLDSNVTLENFEGDAPNTRINGYDDGNIDGTITLEIVEGKGKDGSCAIEVKRSKTSNAEFYIYLDKGEYGKLGKNKYVVAWMDFTNVEFRKACIGLLSSEGVDSYRTDDDDRSNPPMYYLAEGSDKWVQLSHGSDGCFGSAENCPVNGKKGYFAFRTEDLCQNSTTNYMTENKLVTGFYMYLDLKDSSYADKPFYIDNIMLVEDYTTVK